MDQYSINGGWVLLFVVKFFLSQALVSLASITFYVVVPERRSSAKAFQLFTLHLLGDAISPTIIGVVSDHLQPHFHNVDEDYRQAISLQYALFLTLFMSVLGSVFFLWASLTVVQDRRAVEQYTNQCARVGCNEYGGTSPTSVQDKQVVEQYTNHGTRVDCDENDGTSDNMHTFEIHNNADVCE